ncbi:DHHC palmitoyltransferase [Ceratobasidium sp. AG-Ba]|nr:DHHC palmitoyltransferase [Ceratobasidium sp. AG-Ba]
MASSISTPAPSTVSRTNPSTPTPNHPSTPAQLFYGARGRSGSIASSFARQQAGSIRDQAHSPPPLPPLPASHSAPNNTTHPHHAHSSSTSSFPRSSTFPSLSSPIRTTFPGSPVRSTFGTDVLPPIRAGESFSIGIGAEPRPSSPSKSGSGFVPIPRNPSPLGHGHTNSLSLALPPSTRGQNRVASATNTWSSASAHSINSTMHKHTMSSSTVGEQIPLAKLPSKQSREALIPLSAGGKSGERSGGSSPSFGALLLNAGKRASLSFGGGGRDKEGDSPREKTVSVVRASPEVPEVDEEREKEKGWGDSVGGIRNPRESIVKFTTRQRSRSVSLESQPQGRSTSGESSRPKPSPKQAGSAPTAPPVPLPRQSDGPFSPTFRPSDSTAFRASESSRGVYPRRSQLQSGWQPDMGPIVRDEKTGRIIRRHELIASESRWFCRGYFVTGGGTRRVPVKDRKSHPYATRLEDYDAGWDEEPRTGSTHPPLTGSSRLITGDVEKAEKDKREKRNRLTLIPYPFVFSLFLVLATSGTWMGTTCVWWWRHVSPAVAGVGAWLVLLVVVSMGRTAFTDPGIVPRNLDLTPAVEEDGTPYARDLYVRGIP